MKDKIEWKGSSFDYDKLNELTNQKISAGYFSKTHLKGYKHSEKARKNMSQAHIGKPISQEHLQKWNDGRRKQAWELLLSRVSQEMIIEAIEIHGNHQQHILEHLDISIYTFRKLCKHYNIPIVKKSNYEKTEWARTQQAKVVLCWKYDKSLDGGKGEFVGEYYSATEASRQLGFKGHQKITLVCNKKRPHTQGYYFEYKPIV